MKSSKIAIFIDVENITQWVKEDGSEKLLSELNSKCSLPKHFRAIKITITKSVQEKLHWQKKPQFALIRLP
jgi:hypothetical protein